MVKECMVNDSSHRGPQDHPEAAAHHAPLDNIDRHGLYQDMGSLKHGGDGTNKPSKSDAGKDFIDFNQAPDIYAAQKGHFEGGGNAHEEKADKPAENFDATKHKLDGADFHKISDHDLANLPPSTLGKINRSNEQNLANRLSSMGQPPADVQLRGVLPDKQGELDNFIKTGTAPPGARHFAITTDISANPHQQVSDIARNLHKAEQYAGNSPVSGGKIYAFTSSDSYRGSPYAHERDANRAAPGDVFSKSPNYAETTMHMANMSHLTTIESKDVFRNGSLGNLKDFSQRVPHLESAHTLKNVNQIVSALEAQRQPFLGDRPSAAARECNKEGNGIASIRGALHRMSDTVKNWW